MALIGVAAALIGLRYFSRGHGGGPAIDFANDGQAFVVTRVVDGDTLLLAGGERVRLLGVDTPETTASPRRAERLGPEASEFTKRLVEGKAVRLSFDSERTDRYGRILAYAYVGEALLNEEIIRAGFSEAQVHFPYSSEMKRRFRDAESEARAGKRGLWSRNTAEGRLREE